MQRILVKGPGRKLAGSLLLMASDRASAVGVSVGLLWPAAPSGLLAHTSQA